ncbi:MAG: SDR family NAD(P)-dependent oxidoreductase [Pseudanabaena sp. M57BS1SP1A06MG]|nr:SDR family NAD(P)-dependent oxidoreductase [Pseudanabaena sp. M53BS1SP1A06MG]MCA6582704.1 SDR family NAD(P)-dependent oxidoreductase [Pseudanabaena sp. M34BS1SP1A06MG]MCA6592987.1 SDR family NAD(P)-dependent oxidoreductase [Pseudanabaena sp. M38BS1SP1A06MG]MCA6602017.1 SDR family NAD(P)-dependent oxidoreductase [Pseudanabaena sp. M57BS1SP1A06MG]
MSGNLNGKVALVTGASRGIGKGIAIGLGEAGALVYITGRSVNQTSSTDSVSGSLLETKSAVEKAGGICIAVSLDHSDDEQIKSLFEQINHEQNGQLDFLVNNAYGGVRSLIEAKGKPFWEADLSLWDACNQVGLRSHYVSSHFAAKMMTQRKQGLIVTISSWGGLAPIFGVAYGTGKSACDRLAAEMAVELKPFNVASISLWPGIVGTEQFHQLADENPEGNESNLGVAAISDKYNWETPLFVGRVIADLCNDPALMTRTGKVQIVAELAARYGIVDEYQHRPVSLRSLRFLLSKGSPTFKSISKFIPDLRVPWWLILLTALKSPKI